MKYRRRCPCCHQSRKRWGHGQDDRLGQPSDRGRWVRLEDEGAPRLVCIHCVRRVALFVGLGFQSRGEQHPSLLVNSQPR